MLQQFSTEALVILRVTDLVPTAPKITKLCLYELSSQIYQTFFFCLSRGNFTPWKPLLRLSFTTRLNSMLLRCKLSGNITYRLYSWYFQIMEIKLPAQAAMEGAQVPNDHYK